MSKFVKSLVLMCVVLCVSGAAWAADEEGGGGKKPKRLRKAKPDREAMRQRMKERRDRMMMVRKMGQPLAGSEKAREELKRHAEALGAVAKGVADLNAKIKKEVEDGATLEDAKKNHLEEAKVFAKQMLDEYAKHLEAMAALAKDEEVTTAASEKLAERLLGGGKKGPGRRGRAGRDGKAPRQRKPRKPKAGDGDPAPVFKGNPFEE
jgi:hypothetical protein